MSEPTIDPRAVTPVFGWHVPVLGDVPNVPADMSSLATGIENTTAPFLRDTGWRKITTINLWTGAVYLRRNGYLCMLTSYQLTVPATWVPEVYALVDGFKASLRHSTYVAAATGAPVAQTVSADSTYIRINGVSGSRPVAGTTMDINLVWFTDNAWPATLPGIPAVLLDADRVQARPS